MVQSCAQKRYCKVYRSQSQQSRLELGLRLSRPFPRTNIWIATCIATDSASSYVRMKY